MHCGNQIHTLIKLAVFQFLLPCLLWVLNFLAFSLGHLIYLRDYIVVNQSHFSYQIYIACGKSV